MTASQRLKLALSGVTFSLLHSTAFAGDELHEDVSQRRRQLRGERHQGVGGAGGGASRPTGSSYSRYTPRPTPQPTPSNTPVPTTVPSAAPTTQTPGSDVSISTTTASSPSSFSVNIEFNGISRPTLYQAAKRKWESMIVGDLPDVTGIGGSDSYCPGIVLPDTIDDLFICAAEEPIDGAYGVLGYAGPVYIRSDSGLPISGRMFFDSADANLFGDESWGGVIVHEMGHVFGIGTLWSNGRATSVITGKTYTGSEGNRVWKDVWGCQSEIPIQQDDGGHWDEMCMHNELMTPVFNGGYDNPLSQLSVAALSDMGFEVDMSKADEYTPSDDCCNPSSNRRVRALGKRKKKGTEENHPELSVQGLTKATDYGKQQLNKAKKGKKTFDREHRHSTSEATFVADQFISVLYEENGQLYTVDVVGDNDENDEED